MKVFHNVHSSMTSLNSHLIFLNFEILAFVGSVLSKMSGIIWAGIQGKREAVYSLPSFLDYAKVSNAW